MPVNTSVSTFIAELRSVQDATLKKLMRFQIDTALAIQKQAQENVKATFGADKPDRSDLTVRSAGTSAATTGRSGALLNSILIERYGMRGLAVVAGGTGVPYAAIHEGGGVVTPRRARMLTIPFQAAARGHRAREFDLKVVSKTRVAGEDLGPALVRRGAKPWIGAIYHDEDVFYVLRRRVTIPVRPYLKPAVDKVTAAQNVRNLLIKYFGGGSLGVIVQ